MQEAREREEPSVFSLARGRPVQDPGFQRNPFCNILSGGSMCNMDVGMEGAR